MQVGQGFYVFKEMVPTTFLLSAPFRDADLLFNIVLISSRSRLLVVSPLFFPGPGSAPANRDRRLPEPPPGAEIQRVENGPQGDASWKPYYKSLGRPLAQTPDAADGVSLFCCFSFSGFGVRKVGKYHVVRRGKPNPPVFGGGGGEGQRLCF